MILYYYIEETLFNVRYSVIRRQRRVLAKRCQPLHEVVGRHV